MNPDVSTRITVPVLLVSGEIGHAATPEYCAWMQARMKDCKWIVFTEEEYGTHALMHNFPEKFNRAVREFIG